MLLNLIDRPAGQRPPLACRLSSFGKPSNWLPVRFTDHSSTPTRGEISGFPHPAIASGTGLLLGIWMSISSVDMVSPRSIETCR